MSTSRARCADPDTPPAVDADGFWGLVRDESWHDYRQVTAVEWGERFHDPSWVNRAALETIRSRLQADPSVG